jgi:hypothetical protein
MTTPVLAAGSGPRIVVGPDYLVSRDGNIPHVETHIATNPLNHKNLVGASIVSVRPEGGWANRTYVTHDGGASWKWVDFPEQLEFGSGDPQVAFTPHGTALFIGLAFGSVTDENDKPRGGMHIYRSTDGGSSWRETQLVCCSHDHEQVVIDNTLGRFAGRIYLSTLWDYPVYRVGVFRSDDDGLTFTGPVEAANGGGTIGINSYTPVVLSDGALIVPFGDFEFLPEKRKVKGKIEMSHWFVSSSDGGVTFSERRKIHTQVYDFDDPDSRREGTFPSVAADATTGKYRDRIYFAWTDSRSGKARILFSFSRDRGQTWTPPRVLDGNLPAGARQFQPVLAVSKEGVLGALWLDTRNSADGTRYEAFFAASLDGGETFLPSVVVSSEPSLQRGPGNVAVNPMASKYKGEGVLSFLSAYTRWGQGGDYIGMAADRRGVFFPLWPDARSGTFQLYTAAIRVEVPAPPPTPVPGMPTPAPAAAAPKAPGRVRTMVLDRVDLVFDPSRFDSETNTVEIPVRLKNTSERAIYPPISLEIVGFHCGLAETEEDKRDAPSVLNAGNGKGGVGAVFPFDASLRGSESLAPGALSSPIVLRFKLSDPVKTPCTHFLVFGMVEEK